MQSTGLFISLLICVFLLSTGSSVESDQWVDLIQKRPNIVLIVCDDLGRYDLSAYGNPVIQTPRIQHMADEGIKFVNAYVAQAICSPSRAAIQTGLNPARIGLTAHISGNPPTDPCWPRVPPKSMQRLALAYETLGEAMQDRSYRTMYVGKWHLGGGNYKPNNHGYDVSYAAGGRGLPDSFFPPYFNGGLFPELRDLAPDDTYLTDALTTLAIRSLPQDTSQRFFLNLNYYSPHVPIEGPPELVEKYETILGDNPDTLPRPHYAAMVERIDQQVGRLIDTLRSKLLLDNTVIIFTSDHGALTVEEVPQFAAHTPPTRSGEYRDGKGYLYEGGLRVPLIVYSPGFFTSQVDSFFTINTDWMPTLTNLAGSQVASPDGVAIPSITGEPAPDRDLFWHYPHYSPQRGQPGGVVIDYPYKLIQWYSDVDSSYVFDLESDPGETTDISDNVPDTKAALIENLEKWKSSIGAREMLLNPAYDPENCR